MEALAVVGAAVVTLIPAALTLYFFGAIISQIGWAGIESFKGKEVAVMVLVCLLGLILSWVFWWFVVGTHIHITIGVS